MFPCFPFSLLRIRRSKSSLAPSDQKKIEKTCGYHFHESSLLLEVLQANGSGITQIGNRNVRKGNRKLALVGDAVLKLAILVDGFPTGRPCSNFLIPVICQQRAS